MPMSMTSDDVVFTTTWGCCLRVTTPPGKLPRYAIVASDGQHLADIRFSTRQRRYMLLPQSQTAWDSGWLSEVGVWLRRLTREALAAPGRP